MPLSEPISFRSLLSFGSKLLDMKSISFADYPKGRLKSARAAATADIIPVNFQLPSGAVLSIEVSD